MKNLRGILVLSLLAAGATAAENPSAFTFQITEARVTSASQQLLTGVKFDKTFAMALVTSKIQPKPGRVFVVVKVTVRNDGTRADKLIYKDLAIKGKDGQPIHYLVLADAKSGRIYTSNATTGREVAPHASDADEFLLDVPINPGAVTLQYGSLPAVPIAVGTPAAARR